ncbi:rhodanese-like domain-containing protein [Spirulina sp. CS-785/01]|uniref:rhodanese-like domain-containing protein n=1 Tax=Spirulina sp. CS-785/01 TaxID=3021716 RepID=UPI0023308FF7|nr:rhodanese-like domain-containing protein [Spirulina sp. CS-785/01]MDB9313099.1 rhodanese-like domain-containing protein [Spirulina sp. CS-785/01]
MKLPLKCPTKGTVIGLMVGIIGLPATVFTGAALSHRMNVFTYLTSFHTPLLTPQELAKKSDTDYIFIDVRTPDEYEADQITNSILVPLIDIEAGFGVQKIKQIAQNNPDSTLVLYCETAPRSIRAYRQLQDTEIELVILAGGITAWRRLIPQ